MAMKTAYVESVGCPRRLLDARRVQNYFRLNNCTVINRPEKADYLVYVSCGLTEALREESLMRITHLASCPGALVVTGCLPGIMPDQLRLIFNGPVLSTKELSRIDDYFPGFAVKFSRVPDIDYDLLPRTLPGVVLHPSKTIKGALGSLFSDKRIENNYQGRIGKLRIGWGCSDRCSYCFIRHAVGGVKSKSIDQCRKEYLQLLRHGCSKIAIMSENPGLYGVDLGTSFGELVRELTGVTKRRKVRWYIEDLNPVYAAQYSSEIEKSIEMGLLVRLGLPIQSGSDRILSLMNRHYTGADIRRLCEKFRGIRPDLQFFTQIIVGFPSETESDLEKTIELLCDMRIDRVNVHAYYDDERAASYSLSPKVEKDLIMGRVRTVADRLRARNICFNSVNLREWHPEDMW